MEHPQEIRYYKVNLIAKQNQALKKTILRHVHSLPLARALKDQAVLYSKGKEVSLREEKQMCAKV